MGGYVIYDRFDHTTGEWTSLLNQKVEDLLAPCVEDDDRGCSVSEPAAIECYASDALWGSF